MSHHDGELIKFIKIENFLSGILTVNFSAGFIFSAPNQPIQKIEIQLLTDLNFFWWNLSLRWLPFQSLKLKSIDLEFKLLILRVVTEFLHEESRLWADVLNATKRQIWAH